MQTATDSSVTTSAPSDRSTQFVPTTGGEETTSAEVLLVVAYLAMWLLVFGFIALSFRRLGDLGKRLGTLEKASKGEP